MLYDGNEVVTIIEQYCNFLNAKKCFEDNRNKESVDRLKFEIDELKKYVS